jgi:acylpyruvate hydrolase
LTGKNGFVRLGTKKGVGGSPMKLVVYKDRDSLSTYRVGIVYKDHILDLQETYRNYLIENNEKDLANSVHFLLPSDVNEFFSLGLEGFHRAKQLLQYVKQKESVGVAFPMKDVTLAPPIPKTAKIICVGKNYLDHVKEMKEMKDGEIPSVPVLFAKFYNALIGANEPIQKSPLTEKLDYEGEFTVVIGKEASHVMKEDAYSYIAGYSIANDISARDLQKRTSQWLQGKTLDKSTPIGPWIVTADEIPNPENLKIETFVNGEKRQSSNTKHLNF